MVELKDKFKRTEKITKKIKMNYPKIISLFIFYLVIKEIIINLAKIINYFITR